MFTQDILRLALEAALQKLNCISIGFVSETNDRAITVKFGKMFAVGRLAFSTCKEVPLYQHLIYDNI